MIGYLTVGADDIALAKRVYSAVLPALGYGLKEGSEGLSYVLPVRDGEHRTLPDYYVKPTFNGEPARAGNGTMVAFDVRSQAQVRDLHAVGLAAGTRRTSLVSLSQARLPYGRSVLLPCAPAD